MLRVHSKIHRAVTCLQFFTTHEWKFLNDNMMDLVTKMHPEDREKFDFNVSKINWKSYLESYVLGTREYILKEDPKTLEVAKKRLQRYTVHNTTYLKTNRRYPFHILGANPPPTQPMASSSYPLCHHYRRCILNIV